MEILKTDKTGSQPQISVRITVRKNNTFLIKLVLHKSDLKKKSRRETHELSRTAYLSDWLTRSGTTDRNTSPLDMRHHQICIKEMCLFGDLELVEKFLRQQSMVEEYA